MKKALKIALGCLAVLTVLSALALVIIRPWERQILTGRFLRASDGTPMLVCESGPTVINSVNGDEDMFDNYSNGDKITAVCTLTLTTYPGKTGVYFCLRTEKGELSDIPENTLNELKKLGWLE